MTPRRVFSVLAVLAALVLVAGCRGEERDEGGPPPREDPFVVRPFTATGPAVCYGPHRDGQRPGGPGPSAAELREDLALMAPHWKMLRVYGAGDFAGTMLEEIRAGRIPMKVVLGAWVGPDDDQANLEEVQAAIRLAKAYPRIVVAVSVGNETQVEWSAHRSSEQKLIEYVRMVRAWVDQPVTVADDFNFWNKPRSRLVAGEVDFILLHAHPMWNGQQLADAVPWLQAQLDEVRALHPDRLVVLGETGWATSVHTEGEQARLIVGAAGEAEQKAFYDAVHAWADSTGLVMFDFEAFDENWKGGDAPAEVEKHWGLFRADRTPKAALDPAWIPEPGPGLGQDAGTDSTAAGTAADSTAGGG